MIFRLLFISAFLLAAITSYAQTDSLKRKQTKDSLFEACKKQSAEKQQHLKEVKLGTNDLTYKVNKPLPFSFTDKKDRTFSLTTLYYTNYLCLSSDERFRFVFFHEGPVTLTEGTYLQQGDSLLL